MNRIKRLLLSINDGINRMWFLPSVISSAVGVWYPLVLSYFGEFFHLVKVVTIVSGGQEISEKQLTIGGIIGSIITFSWTLLVLIAQRYSEYHSSGLSTNSNNGGEIVLSKILKGFSNICNLKLHTLMKAIEGAYQGNYPIPDTITLPCKQLETICFEMSRCLAELLTQKNNNLKESDVNVTIYYHFSQENNNVWASADNTRISKGLSIDELLKPKTTFHQASYGDKPFVFYNSKEEAKLCEHYVPEESDEYSHDQKLKGSIACYKILLKLHDITYIEAIVTISTFSKPFVKSTDTTEIDTVSYNLKHLVLFEYEKRISIELAQLCLNFLRDKKLKNTLQ